MKAARVLLTAVCTITGAFNLWGRPNESVAYPAGYLKWTHVKRATEPRGVHHIYANEKAVDGYRTGAFPEGSIIVFDLLESREVDGKTTEGSRKLVDVMIKDSRRYTATGGWGFEEFKGDSQTERTLTPQVREACYTCHTRQKGRDFVFSKLGD